MRTVDLFVMGVFTLLVLLDLALVAGGYFFVVFRTVVFFTGLDLFIGGVKAMRSLSGV